jgi:NAD(P) transhydrogenase subunit beta
MNNLFLFFGLPNWVDYVISGLLIFLVLIGIQLMSKVRTAKLGNRLSALAMLLAIIVILINVEIFTINNFWIVFLAILIGLVIGLVFAHRVKMIQMPQLVAVLNGIGGAASAIVGGFTLLGIGAGSDYFTSVTSIIAVIIGMITLTGSLIAGGKLHGVIKSKPVVLPFKKIINVILIILMFAVIVDSVVGIIEDKLILLIITVVVSSLFGLTFTIRVGGADMPITISLLNSLSGVAGAIAGLAIGDILLVSIGGVIGASGLLLTQVMCRAMNKNLLDILLGRTTMISKKEDVKKEEVVDEEPFEEMDQVAILKAAKDVIIVPGYGMAIAQAQHLVKTLADKLTANGATVKYAVHPVAGRMPGHMNVLLSEANVDYDDLHEMEDINPEFEKTDVTIVIGANDVLNPSARDAEGTPIYGLPILNVDKCKNIIVFNYDLKPGYAGVDNPIYRRKHGLGLNLGNAADTLADILTKL